MQHFHNFFVADPIMPFCGKIEPDCCCTHTQVIEKTRLKYDLCHDE
jgi:hypothetical protein